MKAVVHVHQAKARKRDPEAHPAIIVRTYKGSTHHQRIKLTGEWDLVHAAKPDSCGATITLHGKYEDIEFPNKRTPLPEH